MSNQENVVDIDSLKPRTSGSNRIFVTPPSGAYNAVVVDYEIRLGVERTFGGTKKTQDEIRLIYQLEDRITQEDLDFAAQGKALSEKDVEQIGKRFLVYGKWQNFKLSHSRAEKQTGFTRDVAGILGGRVPDDRLHEFLPVTLLGRNVKLLISQEPDQKEPGKVWVNIASVSPRQLRNGEVLLEPENYVRKKDRQPRNAEAAAA